MGAKRGNIIRHVQPVRTINRMQSPNFGRKEPEVRQENLAAGISTGNSNCFHLGLPITLTTGTVIMIMKRTVVYNYYL